MMTEEKSLDILNLSKILVKLFQITDSLTKSIRKK